MRDKIKTVKMCRVSTNPQQNVGSGGVRSAEGPEWRGCTRAQYRPVIKQGERKRKEKKRASIQASQNEDANKQDPQAISLDHNK